MNAFDKFMRSKYGKLIAGLVLLLVIGAVIFGVLQGGGGGLTGTAGVVPTYPHYDMPEDGYTCLPTCVENDAKMFILAGSDQFSMSNAPIKVWIMVPGDQPTWTLGIFDGDTGKWSDNTLNFYPGGSYINSSGGNWDDAVNADTTYTLYADPLADGAGMTPLDSWKGNEDMLNNAWWETSLDRNDKAKGPNGHYYYRLEATRDVTGRGGQSFKVRASGYVMTGQSPEWSAGLAGAVSTLGDIKIVYPESTGLTNLGSQTTYDGDWQMYFYIPSRVRGIEIWDGDFDRSNLVDPDNLDTDDLNTDGKPLWATGAAVEEGVGGTKHDGAGRPPDDNTVKYFNVSPAVTFEIIDPDGAPIYTNDNPSGTEEWERYSVNVDPSTNPDFVISRPLKAGMYTYHIMGLDLHNAVWIGVSYPVCDPKGCPVGPWEDPEDPGDTVSACPRTIGYWKNNVKKIYIQKKTSGIQESKASLDWGFRNVALASKLYRKGINVKAPVAIENATQLTPAEANAILQKTNGNSMLDRALQQNLATWMNLATGKIAPNSEIVITGIAGGDFEGTMMEALRWSEAVMLDPAKRADATMLERAKDIADMINNASINVDPDTELACTAYEQVAPPDQQPPKHDKMPKAPKPEPPVVEPNPDPVCTAGNTYGVENTTNNPFYSVKFEFSSGEEVKNGGYDVFTYTLPSDVVAAMTSMQVEAKAGEDSRTYDLACDFTSAEGCGLPVGDDAYSVSFDGATDNGDGTYTLKFTVFVYGEHGLSHVSFGLPEGQTAGGLDEGNYTSGSCE